VDYIKHRNRKQVFSPAPSQKRGIMESVRTIEVSDFDVVRDAAGSKFALYVVRVHADDSPTGSIFWEIRRRFSQFSELHEKLKSVVDLPPLPPKRMFGSFSREFLSQRQADLEQYLQSLLAVPEITESSDFVDFLWKNKTLVMDEVSGSSSRPVSTPQQKSFQKKLSPAPEQERMDEMHLDEASRILDVDGSDDEFADAESDDEPQRLEAKGFFTPLTKEKPEKPELFVDTSMGTLTGFEQCSTSGTEGTSVTVSSSASMGSHYKPSLDDFEMVRVLGKGSFGKVILAKKRETEKLFAMKVLKKKHVVKRKQVLHTKTERSVLGIVDHPFIVKLHYAFQTGDKLHFVLDFCAGGELFYHLGRAGRFSEELSRFYTAEIALALGHLHTKGVVYRDLKPENVLLDAEGHLKLADFGLSKEGIQSGIHGTHSFCGTPEYLAPEVLNRRGHGTAVDWWSLGALLYEMLTGLPPWYSQDRQEMFQSIQSSALRFPDYIPADTRSILTAFLERDVHRRLGSVKDIEEVKGHQFFDPINWKKLFSREVDPPFVPRLRSMTDTANFDTQFTRMPINSIDAGNFSSSSPRAATGLSTSMMSADGQPLVFDGFTFIEPSALMNQMKLNDDSGDENLQDSTARHLHHDQEEQQQHRHQQQHSFPYPNVPSSPVGLTDALLFE